MPRRCPWRSSLTFALCSLVVNSNLGHNVSFTDTFSLKYLWIIASSMKFMLWTMFSEMSADHCFTYEFYGMNALGNPKYKKIEPQLFNHIQSLTTMSPTSPICCSCRSNTLISVSSARGLTQEWICSTNSGQLRTGYVWKVCCHSGNALTTADSKAVVVWTLWQVKQN